jgi:DNA modification methylase/ParB-like chromosome segregation protein Spo0J
MTCVIQCVPVGSLQPHPLNPRLCVRQDIVELIAAQIQANGFPEEHAILCRPKNGHFEIVSGHHRVEAARLAGLSEIPAWVREMADEDAFMQLVLANAQGELSLLEIGIHAFRAVEKAQGKRGAGVQSYADRLGRKRQDVSLLQKAGEVFLAANLAEHSARLRDSAYHLASLHPADRRAWGPLARAVAEKGWTVEETKEWVARIRTYEIPERWEREFLPFEKVIEKVLAGAEFSAATVKHLCATVELALDDLKRLEAEMGSEAVERSKAEFLRWLSAEQEGASWDHRRVTQKREELTAALQQVDSCWQHGDWRDHVSEIADGAMALLLTDPPYGIGLEPGERKSSELKPIHNDDPTRAISELEAMLKALLPKLQTNAHVLCFTSWQREHEFRAVLESLGLTVRNSLVWVKDKNGLGDLEAQFAPKHERILYAVKGAPGLYHREPDVLEAPRVATDNHPTEKPVCLLRRLIEATTAAGQLVGDPFGGVASILVAAKECSRRYWGCELDEEYFQIGQRRLKAIENVGEDDRGHVANPKCAV